ncbi:hypothetical protein GCM10022254_33150 [Actinomadura meridiana]|uniref:HTH cro/C1-type domain-containing protein n=1 Tax=Actinomadura meridiana TaxID=559626 RepID=A0ABP8C331_9ACTN
MPRPENPLDPTAGPVAAFAVALRRLRADAGGISYRAMATRSFYGYTTLAEAASGQRFPSWEVTRAYVLACGGDLREWERRWREAADVLRRGGGDKNGERSPPRRTPYASPRTPAVRAAQVDPTRARTSHELVEMLDELRSRAGLSLRQLVERSRSETSTGPVAELARTTVSEILRGERPPRVQVVLRIVELCGGTSSDLRNWAAACHRLARPPEDGVSMLSAPPAVGETAAATWGTVRFAPAGYEVSADGPSSVRALEHGRRAGPTVLRILLGARLRRLREDCGISVEDAGYVIRSSASKVSRMELGRVGFKERDVDDLLTLYRVADFDERVSLLRLARETNGPGWWHRYGDLVPSWFETYLGLEEAASVVRSFELRLVPELLQTEGYARAVVRRSRLSASEGEVERLDEIRAKRWERFTSPGAPELWAVLDEAVVYRPVGNREVMRAQIRHLIEMSELPHVTLQIMPFGAGRHAAEGGPFTILRFADPGLSDVVYLEQLTSALYLDKPAEVEIYGRAMTALTAAAAEPELTVGYLTRFLKEL